MAQNPQTTHPECGQSPQSAQAIALYAAPVSPTANMVAWTACARWLAWSDYAGEVMEAPFAAEVFALASDQLYSSCRNNTRLMLATHTLRRNRLQALTHYPSQLAHVMQSPHHGYDLHGTSARAWRHHEPI